MNDAITKGIKVSVSTQFRADLTQIEKNLYFYNYTIHIENLSGNRVQLISRYWCIVDSLSPTRIIEGKGVVGEQPILEPGEFHVYTSGCDLSSEVGFMEGYFNFSIINDAGVAVNDFQVDVPRFKLEFEAKMN